MKTFVIAEAGVNHNGCMEKAKRLIDAAADAGADAVKFQTFRTAHLVARHAPKAAYQKHTTDPDESQFDMIRKLELDEASHEALIAHAMSCGVEFLSTPFDTPSLHLLTRKFGISTVKLSSGDITNAPFLLDVGRAAKRIIMSTGMSTLADIEAALGVLAFGITCPADVTPGRDVFAAAFASDVGQHALRHQVALLHCTTEYPAPFGEVNLRAMDTMASAFGLTVGYSDHTPGIHVAIAAAARGAAIIEKHFTLDRTLPGPDHQASLEPSELKAMVAAIRDIELVFGDGVKRPTASESKNRAIARKSLVAARALAAGEALELACKRPGSGLSPFDFWHLSGRPALRDYAADEVLDD
ncbi:MAG: N-acetylneuraminate synthase [Methyloversatilis sp.]|uniref:N-acetylneuraminate synthase n=1 Tax=Methyloversatilis sp. TaxID=2569862 RepID=UPI002735EC22|nr:N-acetylneuraminate synthase [Methyloversatilis sp.]MDP3871345.1 N-acetylneuraminate synthase [Methyloversatilis sp.]